MKIQFLLPNNSFIKLYKIEPYKFIIFKCSKNSFFFKLTNSIKFQKIKNKILFFTKKLSLNIFLSLRALCSKFISSFNLVKNNFCKKLFLHGLGFKILSIVQNKFIDLKIGYSHFVRVAMPIKPCLTLHVNRNMIVIEGFSKDKVGNFANKIKSFRIPDSYKGKGIWYKKEIKNLKEIKKT